MPAVRPGVRGAVITGWGTALPPKTLTNQDLADMGLDTNDEWIVERTGIRERHVGGTTAGLSAEAGRLALGMSGLDPAIDRRHHPGHHDARPHGAGHVGHRRRRARAALRGVRPQRRLLRVHVRDGRRPRADRHRRRADPRHRHRHAGPHHRLGGPQHRRAVRRRLGRRRARGGRRARRAAGVGPRRRRQRRALPLCRGRRDHEDGRQGGLPPGRADHGRLGRRSRWPPPA